MNWIWEHLRRFWIVREKGLSHNIVVRHWLGLQSSEGLGRGDLLPRGSLMWLVNGCSHDRTWCWLPPEQVIQETRMEAVMPFMASPWKLSPVTAAVFCWSQRVAVIQCGEALPREWIPGGNHWSRRGGQAGTTEGFFRWQVSLSWVLQYKYDSIWQIRRPLETKQWRHWAADNRPPWLCKAGVGMVREKENQSL